MAQNEFDKKARPKSDSITIKSPDPDLTFREVYDHVVKTEFQDLRGFDAIGADIWFTAGNMEIRAQFSSSDPDDRFFRRTLLLFAQMDMLIDADHNEPLLERYADTPSGIAYHHALDQLLNQKCSDLAGIRAACDTLNGAYIDFLTDIAEQVFEGPLVDQLDWIFAVNQCEDNNAAKETAISRMGVHKIRSYVERAQNTARSVLSQSTVVDLNERRALKDVQQTLMDCLKAFNGGYGYMHVGMLGPRIHHLKEIHALKNEEETGQAKPKGKTNRP